MLRLWRPFATLLVASLIGACDTPTEPTQLEVDLTASPDPAIAATSTDVTYKIESNDTDEPDEVRTYPWRTSFVVTLQETGGTALDITSVTLRVQQATGGIVIAPSGGEVEHYQFNSSASGNRLSANGRATVGFEVWYDLPNNGREALVTVSFGFREVNQGDDNDYDNFTDAVEVKVAP